MWRRMTTGLALTTLMGLGLFTWLWGGPYAATGDCSGNCVVVERVIHQCCVWDWGCRANITNRRARVHKFPRVQNPPTPCPLPPCQGGEGRGEGGFEADGFTNSVRAIGVSTEKR